MVEKQASACTCHCILRYCNETKSSTKYHDRCETFCHLRVFRQALNVVLSWSHLPALAIDCELSYVDMAYVHIYAYK